MTDYAARFSAIAFDISDLSESEKLDKFFRGLKSTIRKEIVLKGKPSTFTAMLREAERIDAILFENSPNGNRRNNYNFSSYGNTQEGSGNGPEPMQLGTMTPAKTAGRYQRLTPALREQLIKEGRCLYCKQPGHLAINCPNKRNTPHPPNHPRQ